MAIETTIRALLNDSNLLPDIVEDVLRKILESWLDGHQEAEKDALSLVWNAFDRSGLAGQTLKGPLISFTKPKVRVAQVMDAASFVMYRLDRKAVPFSSTGDLTERQIKKLIMYVNTYGSAVLRDGRNSRLPVVWTTLDDEIRGKSIDEIQQGLGLQHYRNDPLIAISYFVDACDLRTPTVLDAGLSPKFVSKINDNADFPRAWNWARNEWGLAEMVHAPRPLSEEIEIRYLGRTIPQRSHDIPQMSSFTIGQSDEIENIIEHVLQQITAHRALGKFISGQMSILSLTPLEFEQFVGLLYERRGYKTIVTKASHDQGIDAIAFSDNTHNDGILIQAKHTQNTVGISVIRELIGARFLAKDEYSEFILAVITTGKFSHEAKAAENQFTEQIQLADYKELQRTLEQYRNIGIKDIAEEAIKRRTYLYRAPIQKKT